MILYEFEGKKLLAQAGINIPHGQIINSVQDDITIKSPYVLKAQVLSGKRAQAGGIIKVDSGQGVVNSLKQLFDKIINGEKVEKVFVEEMVEYRGPEYYVSISYDTDFRGSVLTISSSGGTGVEEHGAQSFEIDSLAERLEMGSEKWKYEVGSEIIEKLVQLFFEQDMLLLEVNPLVEVNGVWIALDAKVKLDDSAASRHENWQFPPRSAPGHTPTKNEIEAKKIDEGDYRGVAGSTYFDLPGDIAVLSSGGGVSLTAMDALIKAGGKPANFTEYSGNPPKEKVVKLTKVVLNKRSFSTNKPDIHGLWVIGTVAANFTDIYETLSGFVEGLRELKSQGIKVNFPIVIRRGGPRDKEAFEMLRKVNDFNIILQKEETSITQSAEIMAQESKKYRSSLRGA